MARLKLDNVTKVYDDAQGRDIAVDSVSLDVADGELIVIVGPSGCGKSTTLRMVAGLETVTDGEIVIGERQVQNLIPNRRNIAMVFQNYALYSTMSVRKNMEYGLKHSTEMSPSERRERVKEFADLLGISDLLDSDPSDLSGGQRQRVALGRAIVRDPDVFLLDEPLSNLDAKLRSHMRTELQQIQQELGVTTLYVTHDQKEAMTMGDRIAIINDGELQQIAPPEEAYYNPTNQFVATFLGSPSMNIFDGVSVRETNGQYRFTYEDVDIGRIPTDTLPNVSKDTVSFGVRPEGISESPSGSDHHFDAEVIVSEYQGTNNFVHLRLHGKDFIARVSPDFSPEPRSSVSLSIDPENIYLFDVDTGESLKTATIRNGALGDSSPSSLSTEVE